MRKILFVLLIINIFVLAANAQRETKKEERITDGSRGYSFALPQKWNSKPGEGGYILTNESEGVRIVVKPHSFTSFESFIKANIESDDLKQAGEIQNLENGGKMIRFYKPMSDKNIILDSFYLPSSFGGGVLIVSRSTDNQIADEAFKIAYQIARSVKFSPSQQNQLTAQIRDLFAGKKLSYFYTGNGYSENTNIWLCASGRFFAKNESSSSSSLGSGFTTGEEQGTWETQASGNSIFLILKTDKGFAGRLEVTPRQASNEIGLNGRRFFIQTHNECN